MKKIIGLIIVISVLINSNIVIMNSLYHPIAIGRGTNTRYVLYSNGDLYRINGNSSSLIGSIRLDKNITEYVVNFEVYGSTVYLYLYKSINKTAGITIVKVYDITNGQLIFSKSYEFNVLKDNRVAGNLVLTAIACIRGFAVLITNSSKTLIEVYERTNNNFKLLGRYDGRMSMTIYHYRDTLIGISYIFEHRDNTPWIVPIAIDLFNNKTLFSLPALVPVVVLAYPYIQIFNINGEWKAYVTVYNPKLNRIEYYMVIPGKMDLIDYVKVKVSPYLDYAIINEPSGSKIVFKDGYNITLNYKVSIITQGAFVSFIPQNGVLDVNIKEHSILLKVTDNNKAKIIYIKDHIKKEIYTINKTIADITHGFYACLLENKAIILDPINNELIKIDLSKFETSNIDKTNDQEAKIIYYTVVISLIIIVLFGYVIYRKKYLK